MDQPNRSTDHKGDRESGGVHPIPFVVCGQTKIYDCGTSLMIDLPCQMDFIYTQEEILLLSLLLLLYKTYIYKCPPPTHNQSTNATHIKSPPPTTHI